MFFPSSDEDEEPEFLPLVFFPSSFPPSESELSDDDDEDDDDEEDEEEELLLSAFPSCFFSALSCFPFTSLPPRGPSPRLLPPLSDWPTAALRLLSWGGACGAWWLARAF